MSTGRTSSLASAFQEVLTAIVRVRFSLQPVEDAEVFRAQIRRFLQVSMQHARALGYSGDVVQSAVFAVVALLDESVLNLRTPVFAQWARRPLQEELFGGHLAGETFFRNLKAYLGQSDSSHLADVLELHCLCLLLGYRGRYALGDSGELYAMLRQARARIDRIRGSAQMFHEGEPVNAVSQKRSNDKWARFLLWTAGAIICLLLIVFVGFHLSLAAGVSALQSGALHAS
jgi:type VI secretion system protein ImpK